MNKPWVGERNENRSIACDDAHSVATKLFNNKTSPLKMTSIVFAEPLPRVWSSSEFMYAPYDHVVTGDLNIVRNEN